MMNIEKLGIGLIGAGSMGLQHAVNLYTKIPSARIAGFYEPDETRAAEMRKVCGVSCQFSDPLELISSDKMDAVIIASPDASHARFVSACLDSKKSVFCEKPLAVDMNEAVSILNKESVLEKKYVSLGFQRRFDPSHLELKKLKDKGDLGSALLWKGVHRNTSAMYNTSGAFILANSAGHDIDSARWLLGSDVKSVFVQGLRSNPKLPLDSCDLLIVNMEMTNNSLAVAEIFVNAGYAYEVIAELVFQNGTVKTNSANKTVLRANGFCGVAMPSDFRAYFSEAYLAEITDWVDAITQNTSFRGADAWDGYSALCVSLAGAVSLQENRVLPIKTIDKPKLYI